jgi:hypothetical protein
VLTKLLLLPIKRCFTIFQANFKKEMDEWMNERRRRRRKRCGRFFRCGLTIRYGEGRKSSQRLWGKKEEDEEEEDSWDC